MSSRSDICICLMKEDYEELARRSAKLAQDREYDELDLVKYADEVAFLSDSVVMTLQDRRWYAGFDEVKLVYNFLDELSDNDRPYKMVVLNEDNSIETEENYCNGECDHIEVYTGMNII